MRCDVMRRMGQVIWTISSKVMVCTAAVMRIGRKVIRRGLRDWRGSQVNQKEIEYLFDVNNDLFDRSEGVGGKRKIK